MGCIERCTLVTTIWVSRSCYLVYSRFAETRFAEIRVRGWCLPDSPKPDSPKLGFRVRVRVRLGLGFRVRVRVRVGVSANRVSAKRVSANRDWTCYFSKANKTKLLYKTLSGLRSLQKKVRFKEGVYSSTAERKPVSGIFGRIFYTVFQKGSHQTLGNRLPFSNLNNSFSNLRFEKVIAKSLVASFFGTHCKHCTVNC